jgi:hypothetical protein
MTIPIALWASMIAALPQVAAAQSSQEEKASGSTLRRGTIGAQYRQELQSQERQILIRRVRRASPADYKKELDKHLNPAINGSGGSEERDKPPTIIENHKMPAVWKYPDVPEQSPAPPASGPGPAYSETKPAHSGATVHSSPIGDFGSSSVDIRAKIDGYWRTHHAPIEKPPEAPASFEILPSGDFGDSYVDAKQVIKDYWSSQHSQRNKRSGK